MATNIPPHNLGEVVDALVSFIHNPNATVILLPKPALSPIQCGRHFFWDHRFAEGISEGYLTYHSLVCGSGGRTHGTSARP